MSDKEEQSTSGSSIKEAEKRAHEIDDKSEGDDDNDEWIGPLPTEAVPQKKRKGEIKQSHCKISIVHTNFLFNLKTVLQYEKLYLENLPDAECYEKSYMHRDVITHVVVSKTDFVITASCDGHVKFWKKMEEDIEFVKHFRAHMRKIFITNQIERERYTKKKKFFL